MKKIFIGIIIGLVLGIGGSVCASYIIKASEIEYSNNKSSATNVKEALDELINNEKCKSGVYHHDGTTNSWIIDTGIDYKSMYMSSYIKEVDLYINFIYNSQVSSHFYQLHHFGSNAPEGYFKDDYIEKDGTKINYSTSETTWGEFIYPNDVYWEACK